MKKLIIIFIILTFNSSVMAKRSKVLDFEDDIVEGLNKKPLDSLQQISDSNNKSKRIYLYRKRKGFSYETESLLKELRYVR